MSELEIIEIIESTVEGVEVNRWQEHGHDRIYIDGAKNGNPYVDLTDARDHSSFTDAEFDGDRITVETGGERIVLEVP